jgi:hypothetical protein
MEEIRLDAAHVRELRGKKPKATFNLRNDGKRDLEIGLDYASCACTVRDFGNERILKPGEAATLTIEASAPPAGFNTAAVDLVTNDPSRPLVRLRLVVESDRQPPYVKSVSPTRLLLRSTDGSAATGHIFCQAMEVSDVPWIREARCDLPDLLIDPPEIEEIRVQERVIIRDYRFRVRTGASPSEGHATLELYSLDSAPVASVDVRVEPGAPIRLTPSPLVFFWNDDQPALTSTVLLVPSGIDRTGFRVNLADSRFPPWASATAKDSSSNAHAFQITIKDPPSETAIGDIVFSTNHPACSEVHLPIHVVRRER